MGRTAHGRVTWAGRRRLDAVKVFCMFAGAFTLAEAGKKLISEHRPPVSLQAMVADSGASYPSGHATTAAVLAVALIVLATAGLRYAAIVSCALCAIAIAIAVAASRVYLADHYPLDVLGGMLCVLAAPSPSSGRPHCPPCSLAAAAGCSRRAPPHLHP